MSLESDLAAQGAKLDAAESLNPQLAKIINLSEELVTCMNVFIGGLDRTLYGELRDIAEFITKARDEIRALRPNDLRHEEIPSAGAELDAIVKDTEDATNNIMSAAESMLGCEEMDLAAYREFISQQAMAIFEACGFQDITGQRVTKVVNVLREIEKRVGSLATSLGVEDAIPEETPMQRRRREQILHGPALAGPATSQGDIDAMFA